MNIREWWRKLVAGNKLNKPQAVAKAAHPPALPLRLWGYKRIIVALQPPVQGRESVVLETRFCCAPVFSLVEPMYRDVRPAINDSRDWEQFERELSMLIGACGYDGLLCVIFVTSSDVVIMARLRQDRLFLQRVIRPQLERLIMQNGQSRDTDSLFVFVDPDDFEQIFMDRSPALPRAVIPI